MVLFFGMPKAFYTQSPGYVRCTLTTLLATPIIG